MTVTLEFDECIKDSPYFREKVQQAEGESMDIELQLDRMIKHCNAMVEHGKVYNNVNKGFINSVMDVSRHSKGDALVQGALNRFVDTMEELTSYHTTLFDQAQRSVKTQLHNFLKEDVKSTRDLKKAFDKTSDDYANALSKHAGVNRVKPHEIDEAENNKSALRTSFQNISMDYCFQINMLQKKKRFHTVDKMLSYMHALNTFYHQGHDLMKDLEPFMKTLHAQLDDLNNCNENEKKHMIIEQERHQSMTGDSGMYMKYVDNSLVIEGHLFKRASNAFKTWNRNYDTSYGSSVKKFMWWSGFVKPESECESVNFERRWFTIKNNKLLYQKKKDDVTVVVDDIRLCTVRVDDDHERRFCFEIISPGKSFRLQAESEDARGAWVKAIQASIGAAFKDTLEENTSQSSVHPVNRSVSKLAEDLKSSSSSSNKNSTSSVVQTTSSAETAVEKKGENLENPTSFLEEGEGNVMSRIFKVAGNQFCADCGKADPRWASINLGITMCIDCSGVHRSFGVQVSKVRSLTLDQWEPEVLKIMFALGNKKVNKIYFANNDECRRIKPGCSNQDRQNFIRAKYVDRKFVMKLPGSSDGHYYQSAKGQKLTRWTVSQRRKARRSPKRPLSQNVESNAPPVKINQLVITEEDNEKNVVENDLVIFGPSSDNETSKDYDESEVYDISKLHPDILLYKAAEAANLPVMMLARCNNANFNYHHAEDEGKTPLMQAATVGSISASEYLLLNGAKINEVDSLKRTSLHYASINSQLGVACQLLKRKVDMNVIDANGKTALEIAVDTANADIVTLIRLKKMNEEMKEDNSSTYQTDALVSEVFRDFSHRSSSMNSPDPMDAAKTFNILGASLLSSNKTDTTSEERNSVFLSDAVNLGNDNDQEPFESSV